MWKGCTESFQVLQKLIKHTYRWTLTNGKYLVLNSKPTFQHHLRCDTTEDGTCEHQSCDSEVWRKMGRVTSRQNCGPDPDPTHTRAAWPPWRAASSRRVPTRWRPPRGRCRSPPVAGCPRWAGESRTATCWPPVPCNDNKNNFKMHFGYFFLQPVACKVWLLIKFRFRARLSVRFLLISAFKNLIQVMVPTGNVASATKDLYFSTSEVI